MAKSPKPAAKVHTSRPLLLMPEHQTTARSIVRRDTSFKSSEPSSFGRRDREGESLKVSEAGKLLGENILWIARSSDL